MMPPGAAAPAAGHKPLVLIVDDVAANVHVLSADLRERYRVKVALDGRTALAIARRSDDPPDLVLLDVMMPGMSGHEVLQELRAHPVTADIPVVLVTADTTAGSELKGLGLGACDFLNKPIDAPVMLARVENLVARRLLQRETQQGQLKLQAMLDSSMQFIALLDPAGRLLHMNRPVREALGLGPAEPMGAPLWSLPPWRSRPQHADALQAAVERASVGIASSLECDFTGCEPLDPVLEVSLRPVAGLQGETAYVLFEARDVTGERAAEQSIHHLATTDFITGLPNRSLLAERARAALALARGEGVALLRVDVRRLHEIAEACGQHASDDVLRQVSARLVAAVRSTDTVARLDGASFAILLGAMNAAGAAAVARKVQQALNAPFEIEEHTMRLSAAVGVALSPDDGADFASLLRSADIAVGGAGTHAEAEVRFFSPAMQQGVARRIEMEMRLRQAVERRELQLHYQPQIELATGRCTGVEALLRWHSPEYGWVSPLEFIALAEACGLIHEIGAWTVEEAVAQAGRWRQAGVDLSSIAVNVSAVQLQNARIVEDILSCLRAAGLPASVLEIELTESTAFSDHGLALRRIEAMRQGGLRIAIDDFGSGYSSLSYLQRIQIDKLKIDRTFVRPLGHSPKDESLMRAMLAMARALQIPVVAEGVETAQQATWLTQHACQVGQGFLFSKALPAADIEHWLRERTVQA